MIIMMTITLRGGSGYYYFAYYVERPDLISNYLFVQGIALGVGAAFTPLMTRFIDKTKLLMLLMGIVGVLSIAFYFVPKDAIKRKLIRVVRSWLRAVNTPDRDE